MNFLTAMRISHKIITLMIGLIVGFIVIGVTYYVQIKFENDARLEEQRSLAVRSQVATMNLQLTTLVSQGRSFLASPSEATLAEHEQSLSQIRQSIDTLQTFKQNNVASAGQKSMEDIINTLDQYILLFQRAIAEQQTLGFTEQSGLQGGLAQKQQSLLQALSNINTGNIASAVNSLNRGIPLTTAELGSINNQLAAQELAASTRQLIVEGSAEYSRALTDVNQANENLNSLTTEISSAESGLATTIASALASNFGSGLSTEQANAEQRQIVQAVVTAIIFTVAIGTAIGVYFLYKSIVFPMVHMQSVIGKINRGKTATRVKVLSRDELGDLGTAFNQLLDERINQLEERSLENDQLNNSIISLIRALGMIAQKDLTIKVPVSPDVTGTISDAVNLLTTETAKTLDGVKTISNKVNHISETLQEQSSLVIQFADGEKRQIIATAKGLEILARAMNEVAQHAETADESATRAITNTQQARHSVEETVAGIRTIRETISETEKRTKRLGDRSQEISGIVNLINTIAERTHILALNASMHAASAGEAGRGFAVVADEVQRLAESARQSTDEISSMVNNMRVETSDTVTIMNTLISQVADGSRLAEEAGKRMAETEGATQALVEDVKQIAKQAVQQAEVANRVRDRSTVIRKFTDKTGKQLEEQKIQTDNLKMLADTLVEEVNVFTLPVIEKRVLNLAEPNAVKKPDGASDNISPLHAAS